MEKGDSASFTMIYNSHVDDLYAYGISLGFQREMCKDAIQDIFFKLFITRVHLRHVNNVTAYIFRSFKHRLIDLSRKNRREETIEAVTDSFTIQVTVLDHTIEGENARMLHDKVVTLLEGLNANQREVVYLRYMIGMEYKEIAEVLDIREESARKLLYRTMEKLRQQVVDKDFPEALSLLLLFFIHQPMG